MPQNDGLGVTWIVSSFSGFRLGLRSPRGFSEVLINGMNGKVVVLGKTYNGNMPTFGPQALILSLNK